MKCKLNNFKNINTILMSILLGVVVGISSITRLAILAIMIILIALIRTRNYIVRNTRIFLLILFSLYFISNILNLNYGLFPQAKILIGSHPISLIINEHPHAYRYLVAYPAIFLSDIMKLDVNIVYTNYCILLFSIMDFNIIKIIQNLYYKSNDNLNLLISIVFTIIIMSLMNGRLVAAYAGISIIIYNLILIYNNEVINFKNIICIFIGFVMSTVSSGVMMVSFFEIFIGVIIYIYRFKKYKSISILTIIFSPVLVQIIKYVYKMSMRNLDYFGGGLYGFSNMLTHGFGKLIHQIYDISISTWIFIVPVVLIACILIYLIVIKLINHIKRELSIAPIYLSIPICVLGGLFGISTATMIIPTIIILIIVISNNALDKKIIVK